MTGLSVRPLNVKLAEVGHSSPPSGANVASGGLLDFVGYLARRHAITGDLLAKFTGATRPSREKKLRDLWELTELPADEFADEIAHFYKLPRLDLPQLLAASSLAASFSQRFLREMAVFPCQLTAGGKNTLVLADPTDAASIRAAELALGAPVGVAVASFDDIAIV